MKIPFKYLPSSWGLKGKSYELAENDYYNTGEAWDRRFAEINATDEKDLEVRNLAIDLKYKHIELLEHDEKYAELTMDKDSKEYKLEMARINHIRRKLTDREYEKEVATINEEPYIAMFNIDAKEYSFEFDWNEYFIADLEDAGFGPYPKDEMYIEEWYNELSKAITLEAFQGDGSLEELEEQEEDRKANLVEVKKLDDGRKEVR